MATNPLQIYPYPFDPQGTAPTNKITGEIQVITAVNYSDYHFIVPRWAPFFADSLKMTYRNVQGQVRELKEGIDYLLAFWFISASRACAKPVYGGISFLNTDLAGTIELSYQTLGGMWTLSEQQIAGILADRVHNPRITSWDSISEMPALFPVVDHEWNLVDMVGAKDLEKALYEIRDAILAAGGSDITAHITDYNNPHRVTKEQVGLGNVANFGYVITVADAVSNRTDLYVVPKAVQEAIGAFNSAVVQPHITDYDNPHKVTAEQVDCYDKSTMDTLLSGKLNSGSAAIDTMKFENKTGEEFKTWVLLGTAANSVNFAGMSYNDAKTDILLGTADNSNKVFGLDQNGIRQWITGLIEGFSGAAPQYTRDDYQGPEVYSWSKLGTFLTPRNGAVLNGNGDFVVSVIGGQSVTEASSPQYVVTCGDDGLAGSKITFVKNNAVPTNLAFGFVSNGDGLADLYVRTAGNRTSITTTLLGAGGGFISTEESAVFDVEPAGIQYGTQAATNYVTAAELETTLVTLTAAFNAVVNRT